MVGLVRGLRAAVMAEYQDQDDQQADEYGQLNHLHHPLPSVRAGGDAQASADCPARMPSARPTSRRGRTALGLTSGLEWWLAERTGIARRSHGVYERR
jgi:hypothetical protein